MMTIMMFMAVIMMMMINEKDNPHNIVSSKGKYMINRLPSNPRVLSSLLHNPFTRGQCVGMWTPFSLPPPTKGYGFWAVSV